MCFLGTVRRYAPRESDSPWGTSAFHPWTPGGFLRPCPRASKICGGDHGGGNSLNVLGTRLKAVGRFGLTGSEITRVSVRPGPRESTERGGSAA